MVTLNEAQAVNPEAIPTFETRTLYQVPIELIRENPGQPRKTFDAEGQTELVASVAKYGILEPVLLLCGPNGTAVIAAGERRVAAAREVGLTTVPGIFIDGNAAEIALIENLLRQDLTWVEEAEALERLMVEQQYTQEQLGGIIGKAQNTLSETLSLNRLPQEIRDECRGDRTISRRELVAIARKKQARSMTTAYNTYKAKQEKGKIIRKKTVPNAPQAVFDMMDKSMTKIQTIDMSAWTDHDRENFRISITSLKTAIDNYLNTLLR